MTEIKDAKNVCLFALNSNEPLAKSVADKIGLPLSKASVSHFADGEIKVTIDESVRGCETYVIQSVSDPVNTNLMELLIMVDALRRASAAKINVVMPYYGYARQDRKARSREPITAKLIANLLEMDKIDRLITIDLHAAQVQGFFDIPVDHLQATQLFAKYVEKRDLGDDIVVVSPDHAGVSLARRFAEEIKAPIAFVDNRNDEVRERSSQEVPEYVIGDVKDKVATHAVLSGNAPQVLEDSPLEEMWVTDTIELPAEKEFKKLHRLSVAELLKEAIVRVHNHQSIRELFKH